MSLTIERFRSRCRASPRARLDEQELGRFVREKLRPACAAALPGALAGSEAVVRIRRLHLQVKLSRPTLGTDNAAEQWARAFAEALLRALAGAGAEVARAEHRAAWLAKYLLEIRTGLARDRWEYAEFDLASAGGWIETSLALLQREAALAPAVLTWMAAQGQLEPWLDAWPEPALEKLGACLATTTSAPNAAPDTLLAATLGGRLSAEPGTSAFDGPGFLLTVAHTALRLRLTGRRRLALHRHALLLYVAMGADQGTASPRHLYTALQTLENFLTAPQANGAAAALHDLTDSHLRGALEKLREAFPDLRPAPARPWLEGEAAGLFLLTGHLVQDGWAHRLANVSLAAHHGPRLCQCILAGAALAILGRTPTPDTEFDPALACFAGWDGETRPGAWRTFLEGGSAAERGEILHALLDDEPGLEAALSWEATFAALSASLIDAFGRTLRVLRAPSREFLVDQFLALPGRVCVEKDRLLVVLQRNSYSIVLRVCGAETDVRSVPWLGGRQLEFPSETS